jgi:hypothetical protein
LLGAGQLGDMTLRLRGKYAYTLPEKPGRRIPCGIRAGFIRPRSGICEVGEKDRNHLRPGSQSSHWSAHNDRNSPKHLARDGCNSTQIQCGLEIANLAADDCRSVQFSTQSTLNSANLFYPR